MNIYIYIYTYIYIYIYSARVALCCSSGTSVNLKRSGNEVYSTACSFEEFVW